MGGAMVGGISQVLGQFGKAGGAAELFEDNIVADGVDEGADAFGVVKPAVAAEVSKDAKKGFLDDVVAEFGGAYAGAELDVEQFTEVAREMPLHSWIAGDEQVDVIPVEGVEDHGAGMGMNPVVYRSSGVPARLGSGRAGRRGSSHGDTWR